MAFIRNFWILICRSWSHVIDKLKQKWTVTHWFYCGNLVPKGWLTEDKAAHLLTLWLNFAGASGLKLILGSRESQVGTKQWVYTSWCLLLSPLLWSEVNPSNAEATFVQSTKMKTFLNHLNLVMLVFIEELLRSTLRWVPTCQGFSHFSACLHHFV